MHKVLHIKTTEKRYLLLLDVGRNTNMKIAPQLVQILIVI